MKSKAEAKITQGDVPKIQEVAHAESDIRTVRREVCDYVGSEVLSVDGGDMEKSNSTVGWCGTQGVHQDRKTAKHVEK